MKMQFFTLIVAAALLLCLCAPVVSAVDTGVTQAVTDWQKLLGGSSNDYGYSIQQTSEGGYILTGYTYSSANGDVTGTNHGGYDMWVVKLDSAGTIQWQKLLGGSSDDQAYSIQQTSEGGYILTGYTSSSASGDVTGTNHGSADIWVVKLTSTGTIAWQKLLGGSGSDVGYSIQQTSEGGYILTGYTYSSANGDVTGTNHGGYDVWVVKLDSEGTIQWQKLLGGSGNEFGQSIQQTSDGGYILTGETWSSNSGDVGADYELWDVWVVKLNAAGTITWKKVLGGDGDDYPYSIQQTSEGGYILTGKTWSSASGDVTGTNHGLTDVWVVKLDSEGTIQWQKLLGGSRDDYGQSIQQTSEAGYILTGYTYSSASGDVTGTNHGGIDVWVVKLDSAGAIQWQKLLGGIGSDSGRSIQQTSEGGYILTGYTYSSASGDVTGTNHGNADVWVVKLREIPIIRLYPGWNFVSTPKVLKSGSDTAGVVFSGVNTASHSIFLYNASTKTWAAMTASSKVKVLDGIWIYSANATTVLLNPDPNLLIVPAAKPLFSGWNAIGFSDIRPATARDTLSSVSDKWSTAIGLDAQSQMYEISFVNGGTGIHSDYNLMNPPKGYWLWMKSAGDLSALGA